MEKNYVEKSSLQILVRNMPESIRKLYDNGEAVRIKIIRHKNLKGYGREISLRIWRDVMLESDMEEYLPAYRIAKDVIGYFLYGEKAPIRIGYDGSDSVWNGDFGIRFSI